MIVFTAQLFIILLITCQHMDAYPSMLSKDIGNNEQLNPQLKQILEHLLHLALHNHHNDDTQLNLDDYLPYIYETIQQNKKKRLIDF